MLRKILPTAPPEEVTIYELMYECRKVNRGFDRMFRNNPEKAHAFVLELLKRFDIKEKKLLGK